MKDIGQYDITVVRYYRGEGYKVYTIYPNEDNGERTPVLWESKHFWNGINSVQDFLDNEETGAWINEDFNSLEEVFTSLFKTSFPHKKFYYITEDQLKNRISEDLKDGDWGICIMGF